MRNLGPKKITQMQESYGAHVFYNTLVKCEKRVIKYGVISNKNLQSDLRNWDNLYIAGRLHKPVNVVHHYFEDNPELLLAMRRNLLSAIYTALLLLPETFSEMQLYRQVATLSYLGDFRMTFGEDKNKVRNIVEPNYDQFCDLFHPILQIIASDMQDFVSWEPKLERLQVDSSPKARHIYLEKLPLRVQIRLAREFDKNAIQIRDLEEILRSIARFANIEDPVKDAIVHTVKKSAWSQSLMSLVGVGPMKGWRYSRQKIFKMFRGMKRTVERNPP